MPMEEITDLFFGNLPYDKITEKPCEGELTWFAKPVWEDLIVEAVADNVYLHRLEELTRTAGISDANAALMLRMRCEMVASFMQFAKGSQPCPDVCIEYEEQMGFVTRRVECE